MTNIVRVHKAQPLPGKPVEDVTIRIGPEPIPEDVRNMPHDEYLRRSRERFREQGRAVVEALVAALPGGTLDAILLELLEHKASTYRVAITPPTPPHEVYRDG